jgi:hypothetical protein
MQSSGPHARPGIPVKLKPPEAYKIAVLDERNTVRALEQFRCQPGSRPQLATTEEGKRRDLALATRFGAGQ